MAVVSEIARGEAGFLLAMTVLAVFTAWAHTDACQRTGPAFRSAGHHRTLWIALLVVGVAVPIVGFPLGLLFSGAFGIIYLVEIRPRVEGSGEPSRSVESLIRTSHDCTMEPHTAHHLREER